MQSNTLISQSPSFDTYSSSSRLALIAARVVHEFQPHSNFDDYLNHNQTNPSLHQSDKEELRTIDDDFEEEDDDEEFEFASVSREPHLSSDQFEFGQIRPVYPLFDTKLVFDSNRDVEIDRNLSAPTVKSPVRLPLRKLFSEERERDLPSSCSSSDADELDRVPAEMYCVWKPKAAEKPPESCKKSSSTGSSKRWKFKDLLFRSNSEGKDTFIFLKKTTSKKEKGVKISGKVNAVSGEGPYEKVKDNDRRRTSVAYNKDIVGMFANVNEVSRNLHPF